jgi:hypothetical protein
MAWPIPRLAPVTTATLPAQLRGGVDDFGRASSSPIDSTSPLSIVPDVGKQPELASFRRFKQESKGLNLTTVSAIDLEGLSNNSA